MRYSAETLVLSDVVFTLLPSWPSHSRGFYVDKLVPDDAHVLSLGTFCFVTQNTLFGTMYGEEQITYF